MLTAINSDINTIVLHLVVCNVTLSHLVVVVRLCVCVNTLVVENATEQQQQLCG
jgi:hypothetical protein